MLLRISILEGWYPVFTSKLPESQLCLRKILAKWLWLDSFIFLNFNSVSCKMRKCITRVSTADMTVYGEAFWAVRNTSFSLRQGQESQTLHLRFRSKLWFSVQIACLGFVTEGRVCLRGAAEQLTQWQTHSAKVGGGEGLHLCWGSQTSREAADASCVWTFFLCFSKNLLICHHTHIHTPPF